MLFRSDTEVSAMLGESFKIRKDEYKVFNSNVSKKLRKEYFEKLNTMYEGVQKEGKKLYHQEQVGLSKKIKAKSGRDVTFDDVEM